MSAVGLEDGKVIMGAHGEHIDPYALRSPGELLTLWRLRSKKRLSELSQQSGVPYATLWGIFHDRREPKAADLRAIVRSLAQGLGEDPEELWAALGPLLDRGADLS